MRGPASTAGEPSRAVVIGHVCRGPRKALGLPRFARTARLNDAGGLNAIVLVVRGLVGRFAKNEPDTIDDGWLAACRLLSAEIPVSGRVDLGLAITDGTLLEIGNE